jgi:hypothetical protein
MTSKDHDAVAAVTKIMMPVIRKVVPSLIAQDILSVQPMTLPSDKTRLDLGTAYLGGSKEGDWFTVMVGKPFIFAIKGELKGENKHLNWCKATFNNDTWFERDGRYYFRKEEDRTMFILKWQE